MLMEYSQFEEETLALDSDVEEIAKKVLAKHQKAFEELAK